MAQEGTKVDPLLLAAITGKCADAKRWIDAHPALFAQLEERVTKASAGRLRALVAYFASPEAMLASDEFTFTPATDAMLAHYAFPDAVAGRIPAMRADQLLLVFACQSADVTRSCAAIVAATLTRATSTSV